MYINVPISPVRSKFVEDKFWIVHEGSWWFHVVSIVHIHCLIKEAVFAMPRWEPGGTEVFFDLPGLHQVLGERTLWSDFLSDAESKKNGARKPGSRRAAGPGSWSWAAGRLWKSLPTGWLILIYFVISAIFSWLLWRLDGVSWSESQCVRCQVDPPDQDRCLTRPNFQKTLVRSKKNTMGIHGGTYGYIL